MSCNDPTKKFLLTLLLLALVRAQSGDQPAESGLEFDEYGNVIVRERVFTAKELA
jgi:hypothetical protein